MAKRCGEVLVLAGVSSLTWWYCSTTAACSHGVNSSNRDRSSVRVVTAGVLSRTGRQFTASVASLSPLPTITWPGSPDIGQAFSAFLALLISGATVAPWTMMENSTMT